MNLLTGSIGESIDIRYVLGSLRNGSDYHWIGDGSLINNYDDIGEWRDNGTTKPTPQEIVDEWNNVVKPQLNIKQLEQEDSENAFNSVIPDFKQLFVAAKAHYENLTNGEKSTALNIFADDATWDVATDKQRADVLRAIVALHTNALYETFRRLNSE